MCNSTYIHTYVKYKWALNEATYCWYLIAIIEYTVCALIFAGFNVRGFRGSAAIREYLNVTVNGHIHSSSQSMTSCITKMAISQRLVAASCNFTGYGHTLAQEEHTDAQDRAQYMADHFSDSLHYNSERIFSDLLCCFRGRNQAFLQ